LKRSNVWRRRLLPPICCILRIIPLTIRFAFPQWLYSDLYLRLSRLLDGEPTPIRTSSIGLFATRGDNVSRLVCLLCGFVVVDDDGSLLYLVMHVSQYTHMDCLAVFIFERLGRNGLLSHCHG
jgi:hypothetical protein